MSHTKEPWTEEMFGTQPFSNFKQVPFEDFKRAIKCVNACAGITNEALEAGFIQECVDWGKVGKVHNRPRLRGIKIFEEDV